MNSFAMMVIIGLALAADVTVEVFAEVAAETVRDEDAGAVVDVAPGEPTEIVNMSPQASIRWSR